MPMKVNASYHLIIFLILVMTPLPGVGIDLYTPSLPAITTYFQSTEFLVKLTIALYLFGYGFGQPFFGTFSDSYGRRKSILIGMSLFTLASVIAASSRSIYMLLLMRFIQGSAASSIGVIAKSIITDSFTGKEISKASTYMSLVWGLGPILAPVAGGYLQNYFGWSAAFYLLAFYGFIVFLLDLTLLPETNLNPVVLNMKTALNNYKLVLTHKLFLGSVIGMAIVYSLIIIFSVIAPFFIQNVLHFSPIEYGHIALLMGFAYFFGSFCNRFLIDSFSKSQLILSANIGILIVAIFMVLLNLNGEPKLWHLTVPTFLIVFGGGIIFPNCMAICMSLFVETAGTASAVMGFLFVIATSIVSALASFLQSNSLLPIAIAYLILIICNLILCLILLKEESKK